jgi:hypothetical protein
VSKKDKLLERLLRVPPVKDFRWEELVTLMDYCGFDLDESGGGSHKHFVNRANPELVVDTYRPHPGGIMHVYQLKQIACFLKEMGIDR